eukprot:Nitzschia sp. Nitz4//scaffold35_size145790//10196//12133//NITZ4_003005-RA/size145790-processed-gene-0.173-mRNA-1//1//CDS//3329549049//1643//frame0
MDSSHSPMFKPLASPPAVRFSGAVLTSPAPGGDAATAVKTPTSTAVLDRSTTSSHNLSRLSTAFTPFQPVMTPGYTPRGSQSGIVLLSPGRTITESLNGLAKTTAQQLEEIWDEVGYTPQERASQLSDLMVKFRDLCEQKISEEATVAETFRQTIRESKEELQSLGNSLKALVDPKLLRENAGQSLTDELSSIQDALDILRADANVARTDLQESLGYLVESHQALGRPLDDSWNDIESDLTVHRREQFHQKVEEMKEEVATRTGAVIQLIRDCQHLMHDLGIDGQTSDLAVDRRIAGSLVRSKDSSFIMASKFETDSCTGISSAALEDLTNRVSELSKEKRRRKTLLQDMGAEIALLWEQLHISEEEQRTFTESVKGLGMDTIEKGEQELERLQSLKAAMLGKLIDDARATIRSLWDETNATEAMRQEFDAINVLDENLYDDKVLDQHEKYIRELQDRLERMKPILRTIERREEILKERMHYEDLQKDSDRLKQRGAAMAKQLMEEEKMARRIKKDLPRLTKHLLEKLQEWEETTGEAFQYNGATYTEIMQQQEEEWLEYKSNEMQLKLKKKQEEQKHEDGKYLTNKSRTTSLSRKKNKGEPLGTRPLADSNRMLSSSSRNPLVKTNSAKRSHLASSMEKVNTQK